MARFYERLLGLPFLSNILDLGSVLGSLKDPNLKPKSEFLKVFCYAFFVCFFASFSGLIFLNSKTSEP